MQKFNIQPSENAIKVTFLVKLPKIWLLENARKHQFFQKITLFPKFNYLLTENARKANYSVKLLDLHKI
jgi:hypothetical protein